MLAIPFAYTLVVTTGPRRLNNMVKLATEIVSNDQAAQAMLFAVQPPAPRVGGYTDLTELTWINGRGKEVGLPL